MPILLVEMINISNIIVQCVCQSRLVGRNSRSEVGAVIQEFVIVVPLLVVLLGGLVQGGLYVSQVSLAGQTAYQAAMLGGKTVKSDRLGAMTFRANELGSVLVKKLESIALLPEENEADQTVTMNYNASVPSIFPGFNFMVSLAVTAPILVDDSQDLGDLAEFDNGPCLYNSEFIPFCGSAPVDTGGTSRAPSDFRGDPAQFSVDPQGRVQTGSQRDGGGLGTGDDDDRRAI